MSDHDQNVALPLRSQTLLGVCEAIGEDFGFIANYLRVPLGAIVLASRMLFPKAKPARVALVSTAPAHANSEIEARIAA